MATYTAPLADYRFVVHTLLDIPALASSWAKGNDISPELLDAVLDEGARFCEQVLSPLYQSADIEGCHFNAADGTVCTPKGFKDAYAQWVENGWNGLTAPEEAGGQGLPEVIGSVIKEMVDGANLSWGNYPLLSHGAIEALKHHGEPWQKTVFLNPIIAGEHTATMCLTEPHCGSDLGLLKTRAEPQPDGSHAITGTKIFITGGEHDLTDNITHLVLARLPDAPAGSKGISLFIVPKIKTSRDGKQHGENAVHCRGIEHKMGIHASATCVMQFDAAQGWLLGAPHRGLAAMFTMMNSARLGVGLQGLGLLELAYQKARVYAQERLQMRSLSGSQFPDKPADPIIVHPDVRRMLLTCKALLEGGRALALHGASLLDIGTRSPDAAQRQQADELLSFLTPIIKGCLTEWAIEGVHHALQCFGGHGYIREQGMEQIARDVRITAIYEGTTGIQALDLLARKTLQTQGIGLKHFLTMIVEFCSAHTQDASLAEFIAPLAKAAQDWQQLTLELGKRCGENPEEIGAASVDYLFYSGYVVLAYWWARSVETAERSTASDAFKKAKRDTARFYFQRLLPRTQAHAAALLSGADILMALEAELF